MIDSGRVVLQRWTRPQAQLPVRAGEEVAWSVDATIAVKKKNTRKSEAGGIQSLMRFMGTGEGRTYDVRCCMILLSNISFFWPTNDTPRDRCYVRLIYDCRENFMFVNHSRVQRTSEALSDCIRFLSRILRPSNFRPSPLIFLA